MMMNRARGLLGQTWRWRRRRRCQDGVYVATTLPVRPTHTITPRTRTYMHTRRLFLTDVLLILLRTICGATHSRRTRPPSVLVQCHFLRGTRGEGSVISNCARSAASGRPNYTISFCSARTRWHFATLMDGLIGAAAGVALFHTPIVAHIGMGMAWFCGVNFT